MSERLDAARLHKDEQSVAPYVRALGEERAAAFFLHFGGASLYFARRPTERASAVAIVGEDGVRALEKEIGQQAPRVPLAKGWIARYLHGQRVPIQEIARRVRASTPAVREWIYGPRERSASQLSFFDREDEDEATGKGLPISGTSLPPK